jgi:hypothetical protein
MSSSMGGYNRNLPYQSNFAEECISIRQWYFKACFFPYKLASSNDVRCEYVHHSYLIHKLTALVFVLYDRHSEMKTFLITLVAAEFANGVYFGVATTKTIEVQGACLLKKSPSAAVHLR